MATSLTDSKLIRIAALVLFLHLSLLAVLWVYDQGAAAYRLPMAISLQYDGLPSSAPPVSRPQASAPTTRRLSDAAQRPAPVSSSNPAVAPAPAGSASQSMGAANPAPSETAASSAASPGRESSSQAVSAAASDNRLPTVDASFAGNRLPDYPAMSRRLGEQGVVMLRVLIGVDGRASEVQLMRSSGSARLDRSAMDTVREWRFVPALKGGKPVPAWYEWQWEFRLSS